VSKRRRVKQLVGRQPTWDETFMGDRLYFEAGWRPPVTALERSRSPWGTWPEFLAAWVVVREDALADWAKYQAERGRQSPGRFLDVALPFAEELLEAVQAGADPEAWASARRQVRYEKQVRDLDRALGRDPDDRAGDDGDA
jgi:hypothetical protein